MPRNVIRHEGPPGHQVLCNFTLVLSCHGTRMGLHLLFPSAGWGSKGLQLSLPIRLLSIRRLPARQPVPVLCLTSQLLPYGLLRFRLAEKFSVVPGLFYLIL